MSFRSTEEVLKIFHNHLLDAQRWCRSLLKTTKDPELNVAATLTEEELRMRALTFQDAIDASESRILNTYLQYEPSDQLQKATEELAASEPDDASALLAKVSRFYETIINGLETCETTVEGTPAVNLFDELEKETRAGISSLAWQLRPPV